MVLLCASHEGGGGEGVTKDVSYGVYTVEYVYDVETYDLLTRDAL